MVLLSNLYTVTLTDMSICFFLMASDSFSLMIISLNKESNLDESYVSFLSMYFYWLFNFLFSCGTRIWTALYLCHQGSSINDVIQCNQGSYINYVISFDPSLPHVILSWIIHPSSTCPQVLTPSSFKNYWCRLWTTIYLKNKMVWW